MQQKEGKREEKREEKKGRIRSGKKDREIKIKAKKERGREPRGTLDRKNVVLERGTTQWTHLSLKWRVESGETRDESYAVALGIRTGQTGPPPGA